MNNSEIVQRAVGVLTQGAEWHRLLVEDPDREDISTEAGIVGDLVRDVLRVELDVPADASPQEVCQLLSAELGPAVFRLIGAFSFAFSELAECHDAGRTDVSSADVLRKLSLMAERM